MKSSRKFATDTLFYALIQFVYGLRGIIILPVFSKVLGSEWYGLFMQLIITVNLLIPFLSFRLETAVVRYLAGIKDNIIFKRYYFSALTFVMLSAVFVVVLANLFQTISAQVIFGSGKYADFVFLGSMYLFSNILMTFLLNYFRIQSRIKTLTSFKLVHIILEISLIISLIYLGFDLKFVLGSMIGLQGVFIGLLTIGILKELGLPSVHISPLIELLKYSLPLMPNGLMGWGVNYADRFFIVQLIGLAAVGTYSAAYSVGMSLSLFIAPVGFVLFPLISEKWDLKKYDEVQKYFSTILRYFFMFALPAAIGLGILANPLFTLLATQEFTAESDLVFWIGIGVVFYGLYQLNVYIFHLIHKTHYVTILLGLGLVINLILNLVLVPVLGLTGAAVATFITYLFLAGIAFYYGHKIIQFQLNPVDIGKMIISTVALWYILSQFSITTITGIIFIILLGVIIYLLLLFLLRVLSMEEIKHLKRLLS